jgi:hypothetical protein
LEGKDFIEKVLAIQARDIAVIQRLDYMWRGATFVEGSTVSSL